MHLPNDTLQPISRLNRIFDKTVATYKYYWFISILNIYVNTGERCIGIWKIVVAMVANAWYPIHYFKLSFGKMDSMYIAIKQIKELTGLSYDADKKLVEETLLARIGEREIKKALKVFTLNVPFRFLRPWIDTSDDKLMAERSLDFENGALYALHRDVTEDWIIELNPAWENYLNENYEILLDFSYWNLTNFLQVRNPNVPNIAGKLIRPDMRKPLNKQHEFWDTVIQTDGPVRCIYTGKELYAKAYDLDHFIPWSFVTHDLAWNLMPSDPSINSSKSNKIPDLDIYLPKLATSHRHALSVVASLQKRNSVLDDYLTLGYTIADLLEMDDKKFREVYYHTFSPIAQIAENIGFEPWKY